MKRPEDLAMWKAEVRELAKKVEEVTGNTITAGSLSAAIKEVNDKRRALQRIAAACTADPAPISGKDRLLATQVAFYDDVPRFTQMVNALADELDQRVAAGEGVAPKGTKRILVTGTPMALPNWKIHDIIEKAGAVVVGEEMCTGSRYYQDLVSEDGTTLDEMIDAVAEKYLDINCACFTTNKGRIDDVVRMAKEYEADGVIDLALGFTLEEMAAASRGAESGIATSSMCTVFAESEVTGLVYRGEDRARIVRGLHETIAKRTLGSLKRVDAQGPLVFAGGVAKNPAMVDLITAGFSGEVVVPEEAQIVGAYGAALSAARE